MLSAMCLAGFAQTNIRLNHYWENPYTVTPAFISNLGVAEFSAAARKQWVNFDGAPTSLYLTASTYLEDWHTQLGVKAFADKIGYTSAIDVSLSYAHAVQLSNTWRLHLGLAVSYQSLSYDLSKATLATGDVATDPAVNLQGVNFVNGDLGIELASKSWRIGIAAQNLLSRVPYFTNKLKNSTNDYTGYLENNANFAYIVYRSYSQNQFDFSLGVTGMSYSPAPATKVSILDNLSNTVLTTTAAGPTLNQAEVYGAIIYKTGPDYKRTDKLKLGFFYRTPSEAGAIFTVYFDESFSLSYSYDYNFSPVKTFSLGSHEIMLTYRIPKPEPCHSCY